MRLVVLAAALGLCAPNAFAGNDGISGGWVRGDGAARVRIAACGAAMCAVNTWVKDRAGSEKVGDRLVMTLKPTSATVMSGTAFDPQRNMSYAIEIRAGGQSMTTRGCVLGGLVCQAMNWSRLN